MSDLDLEYNDFVVCPHCGYEHEDQCDYPFDYDVDEEEGTFNCNSCGKDFGVMVHMDITYSSFKKDIEKEKE